MDSDGLPIVGPGIDYTKVEAIHQKRIIAFLNHFITHTAGFLNRFCSVCEDKLSNLTVRIQRLETTMNLLETKLASIPGLENITAATTAPSSQPSNYDTPVTTTATTTATTPSQETETPAVPAEPSKPELTVSQDPRYARFFKMMQFGVPAQGVKMKMAAEGLDPDLLDTPDAAAPEGKTKDSDDDEFSDKSDDSESDFSD